MHEDQGTSAVYAYTLPTGERFTVALDDSGRRDGTFEVTVHGERGVVPLGLPTADLADMTERVRGWAMRGEARLDQWPEADPLGLHSTEARRDAAWRSLGIVGDAVAACRREAAYTPDLPLLAAKVSRAAGRLLDVATALDSARVRQEADVLTAREVLHRHKSGALVLLDTTISPEALGDEVSVYREVVEAVYDFDGDVVLTVPGENYAYKPDAEVPCVVVSPGPRPASGPRTVYVVVEMHEADDPTPSAVTVHATAAAAYADRVETLSNWLEGHGKDVPERLPGEKIEDYSNRLDTAWDAVGNNTWCVVLTDTIVTRTEAADAVGEPQRVFVPVNSADLSELVGEVEGGGRPFELPATDGRVVRFVPEPDMAAQPYNSAGEVVL